MAQPQGVIGDLDTQLPQTEVNEQSLEEEKKLAQYSKTAEYRRLKQFLEDRISYYQHFLPGSTARLKDTSIREEDLPMYWKIADTVIGEFQNIIDQYEQAREAVEKHVTKDARS